MVMNDQAVNVVRLEPVSSIY
nr:conserved hypothetical protein [Yersinia pseudotuberculosis]